jgi:(p)ppGpp synthase/HD superfamily hydrolase
MESKVTAIHSEAFPYPEYPKTHRIATMISQAASYARNIHLVTNHIYDKYLPYEFHLTMAVANAHKYKHLVSEHWFKITEAGCWLHDTIEDTRTTYSTLRKNFGEDVADIIYAVTNEKGKNRKERENDKYFEGIRKTPYALFVKLCDRLANIQYSKMTAWESDSKLRMYEKEHPHFKEQLFDEKYKDMFDEMEKLFGWQTMTIPKKHSQEIEWKVPTQKDSEEDGKLRAGYLEEDLISALDFIEMITRAPVVNEADNQLKKQAEEFLRKFI